MKTSFSSAIYSMAFCVLAFLSLRCPGIPNNPQPFVPTILAANKEYRLAETLHIRFTKPEVTKLDLSVLRDSETLAKTGWSIKPFPDNIPQGCLIEFTPAFSVSGITTLSVQGDPTTPIGKYTFSIIVDHPEFDKTVMIYLEIEVDYTTSSNHWSYVTPSALPDLNSVSFAGEAVGIAVGNGGTILRTVDAGLHWNAITTPYACDFNSVSFADQNLGYIAGDTVVLKTNNAGATWSKVSAPYQSENVRLIYAPNTSVVYAYATPKNYLARSTNQRSTWDLITDVSIAQSIAFSLTKGAVLSKPSGGSTSNIFITSTDNGSTWTAGPLTPAPTANWLAVNALGRFVSCGDAGSISVYDPVSSAWTRQTVPNFVSGSDLYSIHFNGQHGIAVGNGRLVARTTGGAWQSEDIYVDHILRSVAVLNDSNAVAVGSSINGGVIYRRH